MILFCGENGLGKTGRASHEGLDVRGGFLVSTTTDVFHTPRMFLFVTGGIQNINGGAVFLGNHGYFARNNATGVAVGTGGSVTTDRFSSFTMGNNHTFEECNSIGNAVTAYGGAFYLASSTSRRQLKRSTMGIAPLVIAYYNVFFSHSNYTRVLGVPLMPEIISPFDQTESPISTPKMTVDTVLVGD